MQHYDVINLAVSAVVLTWTIALILYVWFIEDYPSMFIHLGSDGRKLLTGAGWGLVLWSVWWLTLLLIYLSLSGSNLFVVLLISNVGNAVVLGGSIAYCRGNAFRIQDIGPLLLLAFVASILGAAIAALIPGPPARLVAVAPSAVISTAAMVAMGWAVLVRCGWRTILFFLMMCVYACLQLPAFVDAMVLRTGIHPYNGVQGFENAVRGVYFQGMNWVFYVLAFLKVIIAISFLGYLFGTGHNQEILELESMWPKKDIKVRMNPVYAQLLKWGGGVLGSAVAGGFVTLMYQEFFHSLIH